MAWTSLLLTTRHLCLYLASLSRISKEGVDNKPYKEGLVTWQEAVGDGYIHSSKVPS
jgi:hypothetical protein